MSLSVALLEDDQDQSNLVQSWLETEKYSVSPFFNGQSLLNELANTQFDLLLIDWELPDINGPQVMQKIRNELKQDTPIIFITSRDSEEDIVNALNAGADDYLVKPIRQFEFLARVRANTKHSKTSADKKLSAAPYEFNSSSEQVLLNGSAIELSSKEFELAYYMFKNAGKLLERKQILSDVWKQEAELNTRTVDTHVSVIRKKLSISPQNGWRLKSVYGHGYRLEQLTN